MRYNKHKLSPLSFKSSPLDKHNPFVFNMSSVKGVIPADPEGDLILEIGNSTAIPTSGGICNSSSEDGSGILDAMDAKDNAPKTLRVRVSSKILTLHSSVFKRMLHGGFLEGQLPLSSADPPTLNLPEDDPLAMKELCKILHHTTGDHCRQSLLGFYPIAVVADKYYCTHIVKPHFRDYYIEQSLKGSYPTRTDVAELICISYMLDDTEAFYIFSYMACRRWIIYEDQNRASISQFENRLPKRFAGAWLYCSRSRRRERTS